MYPKGIGDGGGVLGRVEDEEAGRLTLGEGEEAVSDALVEGQGFVFHAGPVTLAGQADGGVQVQQDGEVRRQALGGVGVQRLNFL